jgi:hypothetical protein
MDAKDVQPGKWLWDNSYLPVVLFDDGDYSVIWGKYKNIPSLGTRWNYSFPSQGGNPTWFIEPDFVASAILQRLLTNAIDSGDYTYYDNIVFAMSELMKKLSSEKNVTST